MSAHCCEVPVVLNGGIVLSLLTVALAGSWHCVGMCGGIVVAVTRDWQSVVGYHLGRWLGYAALGGVAGWIGQIIVAQLKSRFWPGTWGIGAGLIIAGIAVAVIPWHRLAHRLAIPGASRVMAFLMQVPRQWLAPVSGLLSVLLPCGLLWVALLAAAGSGTPLRGIGLMTVFWLGTLPGFALFSAITIPIQAQITRFFPVLLGMFWVMLGVFAIVWRYWP